MSGIATKNLYELLGNDPELDPDREPEPPTKAIDKPTARTGKRNAPAEAPVKSAPSTSRSDNRGPQNANERAIRDRGVGSDKNRSRGTGDAADYPRGDGPRGRGGRGRGRARGGGGGANFGDRHSRTGIADTEKQVAHGWGGQDGNAEWADEKAGESIAKQDEKEEGAVAEPAEDEAEPEPEDKTKSYAAYLAEQAEKKLSLAAKDVRKPNEGSSAKFPEGKPIQRDDEEEAYIAGSGGKAKRERERKQKEFVELDDAKLHRETRDNFRGRGGRGGRGEYRGGEGRGRGEYRGGEGRGRGGRGRGEGRGRGGRGGQPGPNVADTSAFPSLGA